MTQAQTPPADRCLIVIFGALGDLTKRKLAPALCNLARYGLLPRQLALVGIARTNLGEAQFRQRMRGEMEQLGSAIDLDCWTELEKKFYFVSGDVRSPETFEKLKQKVAEVAEKHQTGGNVLFYLAIPPEAFADAVQQLGKAGLVDADGGVWRRVIIEKPFGRDLDSALELNRKLRAVLGEEQLYRIDHYLGKETVQNLIVFRFANGIFEPIWNRRYIDHVQITVAETLGVEGRGAYYDRAGALRDVIENHVFQLLTLVAMEPPSTLQADAVRDEKVKVLQAIRPLEGEQVLARTVRGQYGEGLIDGEKAAAYPREPNVSPSSRTETFAALKLGVENWRWAGVPFYLRCGKRLRRRDTKIAIQFKRPPLLLFEREGVEEIEPNRLLIDIQPLEQISLQVKAKKPGSAVEPATVKLTFSYRDLGQGLEATGYERLLHDAMIGDMTLFQREDMVEAAWRIATPILDVWSTLPPRDFPNYAAGSWGPAAADELIQRDGRKWLNAE